MEIVPSASANSSYYRYFHTLDKLGISPAVTRYHTIVHGHGNTATVKIFQFEYLQKCFAIAFYSYFVVIYFYFHFTKISREGIDARYSIRHRL